jgi:hypothetical protein
MKMIKKIIFLFSITYCFILQSSSKEENTNNWYRTLLSNRPLGLPVSAIIGGSLAAGLKYVFDNNKFLSSFKVAEKIKHPPYVKFVGAGMIAGVGLYELLKKLTKPKKSDSGGKGILLNGQSKESKEKGLEEEEEFNQLIKVVYICPGNLFSLLSSQGGLISDTVREIEKKISEDSIQKYSRNQFFVIGTEDKHLHIKRVYLKEASYAAALYLINENQKELFKKKFTEMSEDQKESFKKKFTGMGEYQKKLFEEKFTEGCSVYDLYTIDKPTTNENLWCYALPLEYSKDHEGKKTYSLNISSVITQENIDEYCFKLTEEDAEKIDLNAKEITWGNFLPPKRVLSL